jgi:hypothetical protein
VDGRDDRNHAADDEQNSRYLAGCELQPYDTVR